MGSNSCILQIISAGIVDDDPRCFAQLGGDPMLPDTDEACAPSPLNKDECCIQPVGDKCCPGGGPCCQPVSDKNKASSVVFSQ